MPITFNAAERKSVSLRVVALPDEAASATATQADLEDVKAQLLEQDNNIKKFYDFYNDSAEAYQNERRYINGTISTEVTEAQIQSAAKQENGNLYFPSSESFTWTQFTPYVSGSSNLQGLPTSSDSDWELRVISNTLDVVLGIPALFDLMKNGQAGAAADTGSLSGGVLTTVLGMQVVGTLTFVGGTTLVRINSAGMAPMTYNVTVVLGPASASGAVINTLPAHSNAQRNTLSSSLPSYLTLLVDTIKTRVQDWENFLDSQEAAIVTNEDDRSPQSSENSAAKSDIDNAQSIINAWQALPDTGSSGFDSKFVDSQFGTLSSEITARQSFTTTRLTQISTAVGSISQNPGDGSVTGSGIYKLRYDQLNNRINLVGGPLSGYWQKSRASTALAQIAETKESQLDTFTSKMKAALLSETSKGTQKIQITSTADFSAGQTVYVVSETQVELTGTISSVDSANQLTLSFVVPNTYKIADKARILRLV